ncbi:MAG: GNAT family N-acetyltransferase [Planctomycetota bacterium]|jgi:RimJ/RimL family protein N-acetyltransferase
MTIIREITEDDAGALLAHLRQLDAETKNMLFEPGERPHTAEQEADRIRAMALQENQTIFVAADGGVLVGHLLALGMRQRRVRHRIHVVVGVVRSHWGQGIATRLFEELERWARRIGARRLELTVLESNTVALELYKRLGFELEGTKRESVCVDGAYVNELAMSKLL